MSQETAIEWTDLSWNPVHGCSKVSPGCAHCYAETLSLRYRHTEKPWTPANAAENVLLKPAKLREPLSNARAWQGLGAAAARAGKTDGKLVFVNSMSDLFHEQVPFDFVREVIDVMAEAERHTFQILTKRPERVLDFFEFEVAHEGWYAFPDNVWMGVSIENRRYVERADILRLIPAQVRFISAEPLLGPLVNYRTQPESSARAWRWEDDYLGPDLELTDIDWLIAGGESGHGHRPIDLEWVRELRDRALGQRCSLCEGKGHHARWAGIDRECESCGGGGRETAFLFKQVGGTTPTAGGRDLDGRTWDEFPQVREAAVPA